MQSKAFPVSPFLGHLLLIAILICAFLIARGMTIVLIGLFLWKIFSLSGPKWYLQFNHQKILILLPIFIWIALSDFWAYDQEDADARLLKTLPLLLIGILTISLPPLLFFQCKSVFQKVLTTSLVTSVMIAGFLYLLILKGVHIEPQSYGIRLGVADLQRNGLLMGFVAITLLFTHRLIRPIIFYGLLCLTLSLFILFPNDTAIVAFFGAMIVWGLTKISFKLTYRLLQISLICLPLIFLTFALNIHEFGVPNIHEIYQQGTAAPPFLSVLHRFYIWNFVSDYILQSPFLGWGIDASRHIPGGKDLIVPFNPTFQYLPLHPHNAVLHILFELGFIGYLLVLIPLFAILDRISKLADSYCRNMALTAFAYTCLTLMGSYGIWQSWLISAIFVFAALWRFLILFSQLNLANQASSHAL